MRAPVVLVTGAGGFTGSHLIPQLRSKGYASVGLGSGRSAADRDIVCDLTDGSAVREAVFDARPTFVVHLAAVSFVGHRDARAFYDVNLFGTLNLLEALSMLPESPRGVLIASSANVYGAPRTEVLDESVCPMPVNHYACSKLAMEHMARNWFDRLPIVITRPFNYTGQGQDEKFLIPKIVSHFRRRAGAIQLGNLDVSRDFSDVRDVVAAYLALLESGIRSEVFNVCSGRGVALRSLLEFMSRSTGHILDVVVDPALVRANEIRVLRGSNRKLHEAIGFAPSNALEDTLAWMLRSDPPPGAGA